MDIDKVIEQADRTREAMGPVALAPSAAAAGTESQSGGGEDYKALYEAERAELAKLRDSLYDMNTAQIKAGIADRFNLSEQARELLSNGTVEAMEQQAKSLSALSAPTPVIGKGGLDPDARPAPDLSGLLTGARKPDNPRGALRNA